MEGGRLDLHDPLLTIGCYASGLFGNKSKRIAFVEHSKLTVRVFLCVGVEIDTSLKHVPMKISD